MQHEAGPAGAEHYGQLSGRRRAAVQVDQRLAQRLVHRAAPECGVKQTPIAMTPPGAEGAAFPSPVLLHHDRHVEPDQRAQVGRPRAVRAQHLDRLPFPEQRRHDLLHPRVSASRIGVDLAQRRRAVRELGFGQRVGVGVEPGVAGPRGGSSHAGPAGAHGRDGRGGPAQRIRRKLPGMGIPGLLAQHRAQPEPELRIESGAADAPVVQAQLLAFAVLHEQLAVIYAGQSAAHDALDRGAVQGCAGPVEEQGVRRGDGAGSELGHQTSSNTYGGQ